MRIAGLLGTALTFGLAATVGSGAAQTSSTTKAAATHTMEDLHRHGGVPPGWRFAFPAGDPRAGREVFVKLECGKCHEVKGEHYHGAPKQAGESGPELSGMGAHHPPEYFAESILNPNAVIVTGPGYTGPDGRSIMPEYRDSLGVGELIDLVAYLKSLTAGAPAGQHQHGDAGAPVQEQVAGIYRVRVEYGGRHLMVFVADARSGEPIPYLPVTATVVARRGPARSVRLAPMLGGNGFHYGVDVAIPEAKARLTIAIAPPTLRVMPSAGGRYAQGQSVRFEWTR